MLKSASLSICAKLFFSFLSFFLSSSAPLEKNVSMFTIFLRKPHFASDEAYPFALKIALDYYVKAKVFLFSTLSYVFSLFKDKASNFCND